jgi:hypothetical protein
MATSQAKARLFDLYPADAEALKRIRERLQLTSDALTIRVALRDLARRLENSENPDFRKSGHNTSMLVDTPKAEQPEGDPNA